jgi:hypothetical protein
MQRAPTAMVNTSNNSPAGHVLFIATSVLLTLMHSPANALCKLYVSNPFQTQTLTICIFTGLSNIVESFIKHLRVQLIKAIQYET